MHFKNSLLEYFGMILVKLGKEFNLSLSEIVQSYDDVKHTSEALFDT